MKIREKKPINGYSISDVYTQYICIYVCMYIYIWIYMEMYRQRMTILLPTSQNVGNS